MGSARISDAFRDSLGPINLSALKDQDIVEVVVNSDGGSGSTGSEEGGVRSLTSKPML